MKYEIIIFFISWKLLVNGASTTRQVCRIFHGEIQCFNYKNTLHFNVSLTENIHTIKLLNNGINVLDSSSFPNRSEAIQRLFLNANDISILPPGALTKFPKLQILDLTDNNISGFHNDVFLGNQQLREIYLGGNNFEVLKLRPFVNLINLKKITLKENHLEGCAEETLQALNYFRKNGIATDVSNLCLNFTEVYSDSIGITTNESVTVTEKIPSGTNKETNFVFGTLDKTHFYFFEAFVLTLLCCLGVLSVICIICKQRKSNTKRTRTYSGDYLIEDDEEEEEEENKYLTPTTPNPCPTYLEVCSELDKIPTKSGNNLVMEAESNRELRPKTHKRHHIYEKIKFPTENPYGQIWKSRNSE